jgi:hypothetical protein
MNFKAILVIFFVSPLCVFAQSAQQPNRIVESCYGTDDSDLSALPEGTSVRIQVERNEAGEYVAIVNQIGSATTAIETRFPVILDGDKSLVSWRYTSSDHGFLTLYRTNKGPRTPTTVNAHFRYFSTDLFGPFSWGVDRLECQPIDVETEVGQP